MSSSEWLVNKAFCCLRFGIELVTPVVSLPDDLQLEEVQDLPLGEDFQWDSVDFEGTSSPACGEDPASEEPYSQNLAPSAGQVGKDTGQRRPVCVKIETDNWGHSCLQVPLNLTPIS